MRTAATLLALVVTGVSGAGCSLLPARWGQQAPQELLGFITPYRMDIIQGNVVTREQADRVRPGMSRAQVRDILGSPMLQSAFHADRWEYPFTIRRQGTEPRRHLVSAIFEGDRLLKLEASELPSEEAFVASISRPLRGNAPTLALTPQQLEALPKPPSAASAALADDSPARRDFPALETF